MPSNQEGGERTLHFLRGPFALTDLMDIVNLLSPENPWVGTYITDYGIEHLVQVYLQAKSIPCQSVNFNELENLPDIIIFQGIRADQPTAEMVKQTENILAEKGINLSIHPVIVLY